MNYESLPGGNSIPTIPKIIHKIWFDLGNGNQPPKKYRSMHESLVRYHPDWEIITWDEKSCNNLVREYYPSFEKMWNSYKNPIYKIDAIRYFILATFGGVYVDQDITFFRSMSPMIIGPNPDRPRQNILVRSCNWGNISNFIMASVPDSSFMLYLIDRLPRSQRSLGI